MVASEHFEIVVHGLVLVFVLGGGIGNNEKAYVGAGAFILRGMRSAINARMKL